MSPKLFILIVCLHLSNAESQEKHIRLLNHIQAVGDTLKLDNVVIQAISKDSNIVLTEIPNKVTEALKKYLAVLLTLDDTEIYSYVNVLERITPRVTQSDTIKEFIENLKVMVRKKVIKFDMVLWWIILNSDKKLQNKVLEATSGVRFQIDIVEKYFRMLKQFRMHELSYVEEETIKTLESIKIPYSAVLIESSKEFNKYVTNSINSKNEKDYNLMYQARLNRHMLADFLVEVFEMLIKADLFKVTSLCSIFDIEIRMYTYKGSSFEEVLTTPETKTAFDNFIKNNCEHSVVKSGMSEAVKGFQDTNEAFKNTPFYKLVGILDSTYTMTHQKQLEHMQKELELYLSGNVDIQTYAMQTLRLLLFDHVTAMSSDMKKTIADVLKVQRKVEKTTVKINVMEISNSTKNESISSKKTQCNEIETGREKRLHHKDKLMKKIKSREKKDRARFNSTSDDSPPETVGKNVSSNLIKRSISEREMKQLRLDDSPRRRRRKHKKRRLQKPKKRRRSRGRKYKHSARSSKDC